MFKIGALKHRKVELQLLGLVYIYILTAVTVLILTGVNNTEAKLPLLAGTLVILTFGSVSFYWYKSGFKADQFLLPMVAFLSTTGLVFMFRLNSFYAVRQMVWLIIGLVILVLVTHFFRNYLFLSDYKYLYVLTGVLFLILPIFLGVEQGGAKSWLNFRFFQFQPSEFVKILLVLFLTSFLAENRSALAAGTRNFGLISVPGLKYWGPLVAMWAISLLLLVFQKDLGAALIYFGTFLAMLYIATSRLAYVFTGLILFLLGAGLSYQLFDHVRMRVQVWLNPWPYSDTAGYQVIQSLIALASGGIGGSGFNAGYPKDIPAVHTDFIFSAIGEELGFLGGAGIIIIYLLIAYRGLKIALASRDEFSMLLAAGLTVLISFQSFIIIAGVTKLLPLTGVTLPFVSYGGSSLVANFVLLGLLLNVSNEAVQR
ncbi:FtsW/RodA/SpoVE family cell cycle protein [Desulfolucanica intricata]|uniref:FtsW/RodA/SpoVE family cell cycle protein n=1 Tax=Desulfolucanica intricata TaxID=1285191 RepID=UPI000836162C|nr:FtsW/RodA/SpoVE family cell cycle protein [Desulfolucanica intricata]